MSTIVVAVVVTNVRTLLAVDGASFAVQSVYYPLQIEAGSHSVHGGRIL